MNYKDDSQKRQVTVLGAKATKEGTASRKVSLGAFAPLGNNAKSSDTKSADFVESKGLEQQSSHTLLEHVCESTGELTNFKINSIGSAVEDISSDKILSERYLLQSAARYLMPLSRTAKCTRLSCGSDIGILKSVDYKNTSFTGLQTCGSPWSCSVCSSKISERRKNEVVKALESHISDGGHLYFVTFTFRHSNNQSLTELREKQKQAFIHLRSSRGYREYKKLVGYSGLIRALEVTWGMTNGWHPHTHEIIFSDNKVSYQSIKRILFSAWSAACKKAGLAAPSFRRGVDVQGGEKAGSYVTKYGNELTKSHLKKTKGDRYTPFDLLRSYFYEDVKLHGAKFVEFAEGMQGSRQLYWTNGLKDRFNINEKTDEELSKESQENSFLMGNITIEYWKSVIKYKARSTVLILAKDHGFDRVDSFIKQLYLTYCSSGEKLKDDKKIEENKKKRISKVKTQFENRLTKIDNRNIFDKLNDQIQSKSNLSVESANHDLIQFSADLKHNIYKKQESDNFIELNYKQITKPI
jgi:hypothetical protein